MSLLSLIGGSGDSNGMSKTASEQRSDLRERGEAMYKVGANMAWNQIKKAAEEATGSGEGDKEKKDDKEKMSSEDRVEARTKEIYENLKKDKEEGKKSE